MVYMYIYMYVKMYLHKRKIIWSTFSDAFNKYWFSLLPHKIYIIHLLFITRRLAWFLWSHKVSRNLWVMCRNSRRTQMPFLSRSNQDSNANFHVLRMRFMPVIKVVCFGIYGIARSNETVTKKFMYTYLQLITQSYIYCVASGQASFACFYVTFIESEYKFIMKQNIFFRVINKAYCILKDVSLWIIFVKIMRKLFK